MNFALPYFIYVYAKPKLGDVNALIASSAPPLLWSIGEFVRKRRVDAISLFVLAGIVLSLLAFLGGGSAKFLQFRENFITVLIGLAFLISAAIGKPLIYQLARASMMRKSAEELASLEGLQKENVYFRRSMILMTVVWGVGFLAQAAVACVLLFTLSIEHYLLYSPIAGYAIMGSIGLWTFLFVRRQKARGAAREAREAAALAEAKPS